MEIERINENTVKFYISYLDIEDRGFEREEIWYNRERSEQLFWQMMDEVNYKEDFAVEGPLWIQVQALEKGLEIIVTKAQVSKNGDHFEFSKEDKDTIDIAINGNADRLLEEKFGKNVIDDEEDELLIDDDDINIWITARLDDFEDVIQLSHYFQQPDHGDMVVALYHYDGHYYLYVQLSNDLFEYQEDVLSQIFEFAEESDVTYHVLEEYGKKIFANNTFTKVRHQFPAQL